MMFCIIFITSTVRELNLVGSGIQHEIGIGLPFHSSIKFTLVSNHLPSEDLIPNRYPKLGYNILVTSINDMLIISIIHIWHLGKRDFVILLRLKNWSHKVSVVRIILEVIFGH
jgi:hypothetical protein